MSKPLRAGLLLLALVIIDQCADSSPDPFDYCVDRYQFPTTIRRIPGKTIAGGPCPDDIHIIR